MNDFISRSQLQVKDFLWGIKKNELIIENGWGGGDEGKSDWRIYIFIRIER